MKDTHFLYVVATLFVIGISACFIGYATDTLPKHMPRQITTTSVTAIDTVQTATDISVQLKKDCHCCAERVTDFEKEMDAYVKRKKAEAQRLLRNKENTSQ